ncbi:TPA: membrane protein insertase YidC [Candidatus Nomurabacteria bacterium]|nr:MAG: Membrane protein insertase, YidC/Oxa1 family [Parcubacteria bacterium RAAC4_OD1_1]HCY26206.1 membrane protein insertase YidC [Candidatus Nomurabacteria bacterium]
MHTFWTTIFYQPIYNALIFIMDKVTFGDIGFAIILLTIIVKLILAPLTRKSIRSQILMKKMEPELKQIKKDYPNKEEQAKKTFDLYKKYGTNPFSGCLVILIQLPVIFALYYVFYKGITVDQSLIYSFINIPEISHTKFLNLIEMSSKNIPLAILTGLSQFVQGYLSIPLKNKEPNEEKEKKQPDFQEALSNSMQTNIKYILPVFIAFVAYQTSAAVALYWITSNVFTIVQEWHIRRKLKNS